MYSHFYFSFIIFLNQLCKEMWHWTTMNLKFKHELPSNLVQYPQYLYCRLLISTLKWFSRYLVTHLFIFLTSLRKTFEHELGFLNFVSRTSYKIQTVNFTFTNHFYNVYNLFTHFLYHQLNSKAIKRTKIRYAQYQPCLWLSWQEINQCKRH
jgi:hypothetical protein